MKYKAQFIKILICLKFKFFKSYFLKKKKKTKKKEKERNDKLEI